MSERSERDACPHCGAYVPEAYDANGLERGSCRHCGLQLVRRPGEPWHGIRG